MVDPTWFSLALESKILNSIEGVAIEEPQSFRASPTMTLLSLKPELGSVRHEASRTVKQLSVGSPCVARGFEQDPANVSAAMAATTVNATFSFCIAESILCRHGAMYPNPERPRVRRSSSAPRPHERTFAACSQQRSNTPPEGNDLRSSSGPTQAASHNGSFMHQALNGAMVCPACAHFSVCVRSRWVIVRLA
jgi:hypothetical protein